MRASLSNAYGTTSLHVAATLGDAAAVTALLDAGADCEASDGGGYTPMHCAAAYGRAAAVGALLTGCDRAEALLFASDVEGSSPLILACGHARPRCVEAMLRCAAPSAADWLFGDTRDVAAEDVDAPDTERSVLGDALELQDHNGRTALHHAVQSREIETVRMLVRVALVCAPEALQEEDGDGETPLRTAADIGWDVAVDALIEAIVCPVYSSTADKAVDNSMEKKKQRELYASDDYTRYGDEHDLWLDLGGGAQLHYETWGDSRCPAVIACHGGPGGGIDDGAHRLFPPNEFFIVTFDQRSCGSSMPSLATAFDEAALAASEGGGGDAVQDALRDVTTAALVNDMELLRKYLDIKTWACVYGHAWGATLALAYATRHSLQTASLLLVSIQLELSLPLREEVREREEALRLETTVLDATSPIGARRDAAQELIRREIARSFGPDDTAIAHECECWCDDPEIVLPWAALSAWFTKHDHFLEPFADVESEEEEEEVVVAGVVGVGKSKTVAARFATRAAEAIALHDIGVALVHGKCDRVASPSNTTALAELIETARAKHGSVLAASTGPMRVCVVPNAGHSEQSPALRAAVITLTDRVLLYDF